MAARPAPAAHLCLRVGARHQVEFVPFPARAPMLVIGSPIERTEDWRSWKNILSQAGVRDARVHDARHTAATLLVEQGVHIRVVQEVLGHTSVTTTERCTHVATLQMRDASGRIGQALWDQG
jgi:integrase